MRKQAIQEAINNQSSSSEGSKKSKYKTSGY